MFQLGSIELMALKSATQRQLNRNNEPLAHNINNYKKPQFVNQLVVFKLFLQVKVIREE